MDKAQAGEGMLDQRPEDDDLVFFDADDELSIEDGEPGGADDGLPRWTILMIDDDEQVHQSTVLALGEEVVLGRALRFEHARSAKEAIERIGQGLPAPDLAFVDMVMESPDAGLRFAKAAKGDPQWAKVRILLRSGQPGFSNEMEQARSIGVEGFAQKASISRAVLIQALVELLSGNSYFMP